MSLAVHNLKYFKIIGKEGSYRDYYAHNLHILAYLLLFSVERVRLRLKQER